MSSLIELAGSFWSDINADSLVSDCLLAKEQIELQTQQDLIELRACATRETTPLYHRQLLQPLTLRKTQNLGENTWKLPPQLVSIGNIADRITNPTQIWLDKIDFFLQDGLIRFRDDPFAQHFTSKTQNDETEITLWLNDADYDVNYLQDIWGTAVGVEAPSSEAYRALLCEVYTAMISGTSRKNIEHIITLLHGGALAVEAGTVVAVGKDTRGPFVITETHVYRATPESKPTVAPGASVVAGDALFNTVSFRSSISDIPLEEVHEITIPKAYLDASIGEDLSFINHDVPLINTGNRIEFEIGGTPEATAQFWQIINKRAGKQLSAYLADQGTINPFQFVTHVVLKYNVLMCVLHAPKIPAELAGIDQDYLLRQFVPPHETVLFARE